VAIQAAPGTPDAVVAAYLAGNTFQGNFAQRVTGEPAPTPTPTLRPPPTPAPTPSPTPTPPVLADAGSHPEAFTRAHAWPTPSIRPRPVCYRMPTLRPTRPSTTDLPTPSAEDRLAHVDAQCRAVPAAATATIAVADGSVIGASTSVSGDVVTFPAPFILPFGGEVRITAAAPIPLRPSQWEPSPVARFDKSGLTVAARLISAAWT
jgi:hypothetical protein